MERGLHGATLGRPVEGKKNPNLLLPDICLSAFANGGLNRFLDVSAELSVT